MTVNPLTAFATICKFPALGDHYREPLAWAHEALQKKRDPLHIVLHAILKTPAPQKPFCTLLIMHEAESLAFGSDGAKTGAMPEMLQECAKTIQQLQNGETRGMREPEQELIRWIEAEIYSVIAINSFIQASGEKSDPLRTAVERAAILKSMESLADEEGGLVSIFGDSGIDLGIRVPLNIPPMDEYILEGGVPRKSTVLLTGASNVGKSRIGLHCLIRSVILGESIILASGEDSWQMTRARAFATLLGTKQKIVLLMTESQREYMLAQRLEALEEQYQTPGLAEHIRKGFQMRRFRNGMLTPDSISDMFKKTSDISGKPCSLGMIDYLQCGVPNGGTRKNEQTDQQLERFVREVEDVCVEQDSIALIIAQAKAAQVGKKQANLTDSTARSYAAIQAAQYVLTILQSEEEMQRRIETNDHTAALDLVLCKAKDTGLGACYAISSPNNSSYRFFRSMAERDVIARQECMRPASEGLNSTERFNPNATRNR